MGVPVFVQERVDRLRDLRLAAAADRDLAALEPELAQHRDQVVPLRREILLEDRARVLPLVHLVVRADECRQQIGSHAARLADLMSLSEGRVRLGTRCCKPATEEARPRLLGTGQTKDRSSAGEKIAERYFPLFDLVGQIDVQHLAVNMRHSKGRDIDG